MACNDPRGQKVLEACRRSGVRVPEQVAVIGVDNDEPICAIADPPLSSVVPDHERVGYEAAALLDRVRAGEVGAGAAVYIPPVGVVARQSSDVLALADREVAEAIGFIREHACLGLGVEEVCRKLALSRSTLQRRFRLLLGHTVHDEIIRVRLQRRRSCSPRPTCRSRWSPRGVGSATRSTSAQSSARGLGQTPAGYRRWAGRVSRGRKA